jgi:hypothetical protein
MVRVDRRTSGRVDPLPCLDSIVELVILYIYGLPEPNEREEANRNTTHPVRHVHTPNELTDHRRSGIDAAHPPERVTLAVLATWGTAVQAGDESLSNTQDGVP